LESQLRAFQSMPDAGVIYGEEDYMDERGQEIIMPKMARYSGSVTERLLIDNFVSFNTAMFKKECFAELGGLDETLKRSDDYELWLRYSTRYRFDYLPQKLAIYRIMKNQLSQNKEARFEAIQSILDRFLKQHPEIVTEPLRKKVWGRFYISRGRHRAAASNYGPAVLDYMKAMACSPLSIGPWRALLRMVILWK